MSDHLLSHLHDDPARIRLIEEREISALASLITDDYDAPDPDALLLLSNLSTDAINAFACMVLNNAIVRLSEHVVTCHECDETVRHNASAREMAEYVWGKEWMAYHGNLLCRNCQER